MKNEIKNKSVQTTTQKPGPIPIEIKPKFEFGTIEIAAIFGIILTAVIGIIVRIWWTKRERLVKASDDLHDAFAPALAQIDLARHHTRINVTPVPELEKFLADALADQATAVEKFRIFVPEDKKSAYQKAWNEYRNEVSFGFDTNCFNQDINDPFSFYKNLIHDLLAFSIHHKRK